MNSPTDPADRWPERDLLERRLRAVARTLDSLDAEPLAPALPQRKLLDKLIAAYEDLLERVLPLGDADAVDALLCAIEAGLVRVDPFDVRHEDPHAACAAEQRKLRQARASAERVRRWNVCQTRPARTRLARRRRRPRTARRRAAGLRSGQDPGDEGDGPCSRTPTWPTSRCARWCGGG